MLRGDFNPRFGVLSGRQFATTGITPELQLYGKTKPKQKEKEEERERRNLFWVDGGAMCDVRCVMYEQKQGWRSVAPPAIVGGGAGGGIIRLG